MKRLRVLAAAMAAFLLFASCADPASWEPRGEVRFLELREVVDSGGAKRGRLDYSIANSGRSRIEGTTFAFTFSTDTRRYRLTVVDESAIERGALVYGQVSVAYDGPDEAGSLSGAIVDSAQFR